jgi:hypothetical protein
MQTTSYWNNRTKKNKEKKTAKEILLQIETMRRNKGKP